MPTAEDFRRELFQMMATAQKSGSEFVEISARELHARVGPPLRRNHRMPNCCQVMKAQLATDYGDVIVKNRRAVKDQPLQFGTACHADKYGKVWKT